MQATVEIPLLFQMICQQSFLNSWFSGNLYRISWAFR